MTVEPSSLREIAYKAFRQALPGLLQDHAGEWVAFRGEEKLYMLRDAESLYEKLSADSTPFDEVLIRRIEPEEPEINLNW
jgi:hypothetical protein